MFDIQTQLFEGRDIRREGKRYDSLWMGILRQEWMGLHRERINTC